MRLTAYLSFISISIILAICLITGCVDKSVPDNPVITLDISPTLNIDVKAATIHNLIKLDYTWKTGATFTSPEEIIYAKVHFVDSDGKILWQDDHEPSNPVKNWTANQTYRYSRFSYIPLIPKQTDVRVMLGMFTPGKHIQYALAVDRKSDPDIAKTSKYHLADLKVTPPLRPEDLPGAKIEYLGGWYRREQNETSKRRWQWMSKRATCRLKQPNRDAKLMIHGWLPTSEIGKSSHLKFTLGEVVLGDYPDVSDEFEYVFEIPQSMFANADHLILSLGTSQTYRPADSGRGSDERDLGIMIKQLYFN